MSDAYNIDPVLRTHMCNVMYNFPQVWQEHDAKSIYNHRELHNRRCYVKPLDSACGQRLLILQS